MKISSIGRHNNRVLYLTHKSAHVLSRLYLRYLDVRSMVYDKVSKRLYIYEPDKVCKSFSVSLFLIWTVYEINGLNKDNVLFLYRQT